MPGQARLGDVTVPAGDHILYPSTSFIEGADTVFVNGLPATAIGNQFNIHCLGSSCDVPTQDTGSNTVFIEGNGAARIGDRTDCGHLVGTGSFDVFTGD